MLKEIILKCLNLNNWLKKNQNCLLCEDQALHSRGWIFCSPCLAYLPWLTQACVQCGINLSGDQKKCASCLMTPPYFDHTVAIFAYEHPISKMLIQYKYHGQLFYLPTFSDMLALKILASYKQNLRQLPEIILPVPLSLARLKTRGFNQSLELAKYLSKMLGVPYHAHVLKRSRDTPKQVGLSLKQRQANLKNAFDFVDVNKIRHFVKNKHIALVDDVFTTGATSEALSKQLKEAGASSVDIWVVARTLARIS
jgi:ComF family protein